MTEDETLKSCAECGADGGHALYCVACAEKFVKREWVGLTDENIDGLHEEIKIRLMGTFNIKDVYRAVEAKLKEKNT